MGWEEALYRPMHRQTIPY